MGLFSDKPIGQLQKIEKLENVGNLENVKDNTEYYQFLETSTIPFREFSEYRVGPPPHFVSKGRSFIFMALFNRLLASHGFFHVLHLICCVHTHCLSLF